MGDLDIAPPATEAMTTVRTDVQAVLERQRIGRWATRTSTAEERKAVLVRLRDVLTARTDEAIQALAEDLGRPLPAAEQELLPIRRIIDETIGQLDDWMTPTRVEGLVGVESAVIRWEPRGAVLLFAPWNFPFTLLFEPLLAIVAAGNTAVVKPNELTPASSRVAAQIIREAFDESVVAVVEGGVDVAEELLELPFDHIFLTGSPRVGRTVMAAAAKHLASVTLELGGKCPAILDEQAVTDETIGKLGFGVTLNGGQVCLSVDYILVPNSARERLVMMLGAAFEGLYYADGKYQTERNTRIINRANFHRLRRYVDDAVAGGASIAFGGGFDAEALTVEPTILVDVPPNAEILQSEIFGPVVPIIGYDDPQDVVDHIRAGTKPLAMYVFSSDEGFVEYVLANTSSGGVTVNGWANHYFETALPFGGVGDSGMGRYHGLAGFRELSNGRAVAFAQP